MAPTRRLRQLRAQLCAQLLASLDVPVQVLRGDAALNATQRLDDFVARRVAEGGVETDY